MNLPEIWDIDLFPLAPVTRPRDIPADHSVDVWVSLNSFPSPPELQRLEELRALRLHVRPQRGRGRVLGVHRELLQRAGSGSPHRSKPRSPHPQTRHRAAPAPPPRLRALIPALRQFRALRQFPVLQSVREIPACSGHGRFRGRGCGA